MAITYSYKVNSIRVVTQGELNDVVKQIELNVTGVDGEARFELPATLKLDAADEENFVEFDDLTEEQIISWVEDSDLLVPTKAHIAYVVEKEVEKLATQSKPLPWQPVIAANTENTTANTI